MITFENFFTPDDPEILDMEYLFTTATNPDNKNNNPAKIYHELVFFRFLETIEGIFPRFSKINGDQKTKLLTKDFMKFGARTPYIWKMSGEFSDFIDADPQIDSLTRDTVWYEWNEFYLYRKNHDRDFNNKDPLNMDISYTVSPDARIRKLSGAVHRGDPGNLEQSGEVNIILFYAKKTSEVYFTEVSGFIYQCLDTLESDLLGNVITRTCNTYALSEEESIEALKIAGEFFNYLLNSDIIVPYDKES